MTCSYFRLSKGVQARFSWRWGIFHRWVHAATHPFWVTIPISALPYLVSICMLCLQLHFIGFDHEEYMVWSAKIDSEGRVLAWSILYCLILMSAASHHGVLYAHKPVLLILKSTSRCSVETSLIRSFISWSQPYQFHRSHVNICNGLACTPN